MITNIIATVVITLVTNVTQSDNAQWGPDFSISTASIPSYPGTKLVKAATERYVTTDIIQRKTLTAQHDGTQFSSVQDKMLSSVTEIMRLREQWEPAGLRTNSLAFMDFLYTNVVITGTTNVIWLK